MTIDYLFNAITDEYQENRIIGWCPLEKALDLAATVVALRPKVVVETGVYGGRSLLPMALACEAVGCGTCIGIDPWSPQASGEGYDAENAAWWGKLDHEGVRASFYANMALLGVKDRIVVHRMKSDDAPVPEVIDLLHLDSQHTEQAVREVNRFAANVRVGGVVVFDDIEWQNSGDMPVKRAMKTLIPMGFVELYRRVQPNGNWAAFQRVSMPAPAIEPPKQIRITTQTKKAKCRR